MHWKSLIYEHFNDKFQNSALTILNWDVLNLHFEKAMACDGIYVDIHAWGHRLLQYMYAKIIPRIVQTAAIFSVDTSSMLSSHLARRFQD